MSNIVTEVTLNFFSPEANSNKVWIGRAYADGTYEALYGRVAEGIKLQANRKAFGSAARASQEVDSKRREKLLKGYRETAILTETAAPVAVDVKTAAAEQIVGADDATTRSLIEYLADVNVHTITGTTSIKYDASKATFSTPLGVLTPGAIAAARRMLGAIADYNAAGAFSDFGRASRVRDYFQMVPRDFGRRVPSSCDLLAAPEAIVKENDILDALEAAVAKVSSSSADRIFKTRLVKLPHWTDEGRAKFREIRALFDSTRNFGHGTAGLKLVRVYEVEIEDMKANFETAAAQLGNVRSDLWHGTKASNLLSILRAGLVIPPASSAHCTGRMFGNGIYTSLQSTKALNYATNMWGGSGATDRRFMFLCDVALGSSHRPASYGGNFPKKGTQSTWVEPGTAGVINHEAIVYDVNQINLRYLCEFED